MRAESTLRLVVLAFAAAALACGEPATSTSPAGRPGNPGSGATTGAGPGNGATGDDTASSEHLLACPVDTTLTASSVLGPLGGVLSLGGTSVAIPAGALLGTTTVELTIPRSAFMEVDLTVNGGQSIVFQLPVLVTIDYSRCGRTPQTTQRLTVWHIDEQTKAKLDDMGGLDNKLLQTITFTTGHFSGYAVAN